MVKKIVTFTFLNTIDGQVYDSYGYNADNALRRLLDERSEIEHRSRDFQEYFWVQCKRKKRGFFQTLLAKLGF